MKKFVFVYYLICLFSVNALAQNHEENGFPGITNFSPKEYNAFRQNWVITQDDRGVMYVGNTDGLLEFDGNTWQIHTVPNKSAVLGMAFGSDGKLYVGAQAELGYFLSNSLGQLTYTSLLNYIPKDKQDFSNVTETYISQGKVYFNCEKYLLIWDIEKEEFEILPSENGFHILFKANETIYVREWGTGLKVLKNGTLSLLNGGEQFANERIYSILPVPNESESLLIVTRTKGLFKFDGTKIKPFKTEADQFIKENLIYLPGTVLQDGNILLGTLNGGVIIIDKDGKEVNRYNHETGIINNTVYYTFQDRSGGIWLATENGISRIDYSSSISYFDSRSNISAYSNDIIRHKGIIYAGCANGVYSLDPKTSIFHHLENFNKQSWTFLDAEDDLLIGTIDGLYKIESDKLIPIKRTIGNEFVVNELIQSKVNPKRIFVGVNSGIWSFIKEGNEWIEEGQILEVDDQPTSLEEDLDGNIWMGTFSNGVFKVSFPGNSNQLKDAVIENFKKEDGFQVGIAYARKINDKIYIGTTDSIYLYNDGQRRFFADPSDNLVATFYEVGANLDQVPLRQDLMGRVWLGNKKKILMGKINEDGKWEWNTIPFRHISDEAIYSIYADKNGITWFASGEGFIKFDFGKWENSNSEFSTIIRAVLTGNDSTIFFGGNVETPSPPELKFKNNALKFKYSATSYERRNANQFSTFLEGFDEEWSPWSLETFKAYTNLSPGEYTFKVKATNSLGIESMAANYPFVILPPWYRTWLSYAFYLLVLASGIFLVDRIQRRRLIAKERKNAEIREATLRAKAAEAVNKALQVENENRLIELEHAKEIEKAYEKLKSTQSQLIHAEKMASLGELTAGIAHEIQNPLNFVNNFSDLNSELIDEASEELENGNTLEVKLILKDIKENEGKISHHGKRAESIVKGMLLHSRGNSGQKEPTDIKALCDEYLRLSYHGFRAKDKSFNADFKLLADENLPQINVVPQDIGRVLLNLINNAFYAVNEKAKHNVPDYKPLIVVITMILGNHVEIRVQDNGNGIPDSIMEKIFQPFFTTKPTGQGTGLGLSLSYDIVKSHGGELSVETSEKGTEFIIKIPSD